MVTDVYSHILDDDRRNNAQLFEETFYSTGGKDSAKLEETKEESKPETTAADAETLLKLLQNPEMANLLKTLAKSL